MDSPELLRSWRRTKGFLLDARANFSEAAEAICDAELAEFHEFTEYNELELALDTLCAAFEKSSGFESWRVLELLALAAASMGLVDRQRAFDRQLSEARGWKYETSLPQDDV